MANENLKKFLDSAGVSHLWSKINDKIDEKVANEAKRIDDKIGDIGDKTVKQYVKDMTDGLATSGVITELQEGVADVESRLEIAEGDLSTIKADYVRSEQLNAFETKTKVKEISDALLQYQTDNDAALAEVKAKAENAAEKDYVDKQLEEKASQSEFAEIQTLVTHFFEDEASVAEKLDQLKEIVKYLEDHEGVATDVLDGLGSLETKVNNLLDMGNNADGEEYTVSAYVQDKINARLDIGNKTVKNYIEGLLDVGGKTVKDYVDESINAFVNGNYQETLNNISKLAGRLSTLEGIVEEIQGILSTEHVTQQAMENYVSGRLGRLVDSNGNSLNVVEYINTLALTNAEIDTAIGATQQTN